MPVQGRERGHRHRSGGLYMIVNSIWYHILEIAAVSDTSDMPQRHIGDYFGLCMFWHASRSTAAVA